MKYNVEKLQQGGWATFTPILRQQAVTDDSKSKSSGGESKESKRTISSLFDDKVFEDLMGKGLSNDVNAFVNEMIKLESSQTNPFTSSGNRSTALRLVGRINEIKQNKTAYDEAIKTAQASGGYGEIAVGNNGEMYTKDNTGKVSQISIDQYNKMDDSSNFKVLTVAELMNERQNNPKLTGQNNLFNVTNNAIGFSKITDHIKGLISALGTESSDESKTYSRQSVEATLRSMEVNKKPTEAEQESIKELKQILNTPSEFYKIDTKNSSERNHINIALNYIWGTLGQPAQQKLRAVSATNGMSDPKQFILSMLGTQTDVKTGKEITPEQTPGASKADGAGAGTGNLTPFELMHNGKTGARPYIWNDPITNKKMTLQSTGVSRLTTMDGDPIGMATLNDVFKTKIGTIVDSSKAFYGDKQIDLSDLNNIIYDGETAVRVMMPVNSDGSPNYNLLKQFNEVQAEVLAHKNDWNQQRASDEFAKRGFQNIGIDEHFMAKSTGDVKPFLVMYGYTAEDAHAAENNGQIRPLDWKEQEGVQESLKTIWKAGKIDAPTGWFDRSTTYYKGSIAIPYVEDASIFTGAMGKHITAPNTPLVDARVKKEISKGTVVNANSSALK